MGRPGEPGRWGAPAIRRTAVLTSIEGMNKTSFAFVAAPVCLAGYGLVRLAAGRNGPDAGWITGHLIFLAGLLLFVPVIDGLRRRSRSRLGGTVSAAITFTGLAAVIAQISIDLYVGFAAADKAAMSRMFTDVKSHAGVQPLVYTVVPLLFYVGLIALAALTMRPLGIALTVLSIVLMAADLDLIPLGAVVLLAAFRTRPVRPAVVAAA